MGLADRVQNICATFRSNKECKNTERSRSLNFRVMTDCIHGSHASPKIGGSPSASRTEPRHRHQEFLSFLNHLERNVPAGLEVHLIAENCATHKHPRVKAWLARRPRFHLH